MSETKHTPGKLQLEWNYREPDVLTENGDLFAAVYSDERCEADAARIVLTWNCHDDLVAALERAAKDLAAIKTAHLMMARHHVSQDIDAAEFRVLEALSRATSPTP